ncbi:MAG TPA: hydrogenase accessory protein HypB [Desulfotomaculum sp.]|nr:MAG: hydantoin utilization protein A [Peptococcaceae bacterium BRH_c8a]KJS75526.1 MAG: hydantoin utilization protein A [Desulfotomaculum sp. BICA1-6]HBX23260.1 hydrogenase accessory protein HypB [Desulfotomaculum sp.]
MKVEIGKNLLCANADQADKNRELFRRRGAAVINIISSPGSGKTALLEKTAQLMGDKFKTGVIVGDLYTDRDARRLNSAGATAVQINTDGLCHLTAAMVFQAFKEIEPENPDLLFIENVGNLVCPAAFDLGENAKVALLSVAEGTDKPAKYPGIFREAAATVISKVDLLPYTDFDLTSCLTELKELNGKMEVFVTSARTGEGLAKWCRWLEEFAAATK